MKNHCSVVLVVSVPAKNKSRIIRKASSSTMDLAQTSYKTKIISNLPVCLCFITYFSTWNSKTIIAILPQIWNHEISSDNKRHWAKQWNKAHVCHYNNVIVSAKASHITSSTIVYSTVYSGADQRKHQSSTQPAILREIYRWPVNSPHKGPVTRKRFLFDKVIMSHFHLRYTYTQTGLFQGH